LHWIWAECNCSVLTIANHMSIGHVATPNLFLFSGYCVVSCIVETEDTYFPPCPGL
jgi:hypothetical protein